MFQILHRILHWVVYPALIFGLLYFTIAMASTLISGENTKERFKAAFANGWVIGLSVILTLAVYFGPQAYFYFRGHWVSLPHCH